jgi:hypothetical protein
MPIIVHENNQPSECPEVNEVMTIEEIYSRYDAEWVLVEDPEVNEHLEVLRGKVVCHSKNRDAVDQKAIELRLKHSAFLYTGTIPEDAVIGL